MLVTSATDQRTIRQKKRTMWRSSWSALPIIQCFNLAAED